jgi:hypothetical protein
MYTNEHIAIDDWSETSTGNYSVWSGCDSPLSTVFEKNGWWGIVIDTDSGCRLVDEWFNDAEQAIDRATDILNGAPHNLVDAPRATKATPWKQQAKQHNGSPTFGRTTQDGFSLSVKKAASGKWLYTKYRGPVSSQPVGWFATAEEARQTADTAHP